MEFCGMPIAVPFVDGKTAFVTIHERVDQPVEGYDAFDWKARAVVKIGDKSYGRFTVLENRFDREGANGRIFRAGTVTVMEPTTMKNGKFVPKYFIKAVDDMKVAVRMAYMAAFGVSEQYVRYALEDRYGQTCATGCDRLWRPGRGHAEYECLCGMRKPVDSAEMQQSNDSIIDMGNRLFQAFSSQIRETTMPQDYLGSVEKLDTTLEAICHGLKKDTGVEFGHMVFYPFFEDEDVIDPLDPDGIALDPDRVYDALVEADAFDLFFTLMFDGVVTAEDYEAYPHTISHYMETCVMPEKAEHMQFLGTEPMVTYGYDSTCAYGRSDHHKVGFLTTQIEEARILRERLLEEGKPQVATSTTKRAAYMKGYLMVNVDEGALKPSDETMELPNPQFIEAYLVELRAKFGGLKHELAKIVSHDRIVVVSDDDYDARKGIGFEIGEDGRPVVIDNAGVDARHVVAWVLSKISERHEIASYNG